MSLQKVKDRDQFGVTFADPNLPSDTTRIKQETKPKVISGVNTNNHVLEVVALRGADLNEAGVKETISFRVKLSGSDKNKEVAKDLARDVMAAIAVWLDEDTFVGFDPQTAPNYDTQA